MKQYLTTRRHLKGAFLIFISLCWLGAFSSPAYSAPATSVDVMYAGSLAQVMENVIGPAFLQHTEIQFRGYAGGSTKLANEIEGGIRRADIFISAHPSVNQRLMGASNGDHVRWYAAFMQSPLAIGYNPRSRFAKALQQLPWYQVASRDGFKLGRTDAILDPKGALSMEAINNIAKRRHNAGLATSLLNNSQVFPEETLVGRLQSGQLDAGFFYSAEAAAVGIPSISIAPINLGATYTITQLQDAAHPAAASQFIQFLLGPQGRQLLHQNGYALLSAPRLKGDVQSIPASLQPLVGAPQ